MSEQKEWVAQRVADARSGRQLTDAAVGRISAQLGGEFQERHLSATELGKLAAALIADMTPTTRSADSNR